MQDQAASSADIAAVHALIARLAANDIEGDDRAALLALRDAVIARAPLEDMRPLTNVERLQKNARARFDATFKRPTEGPVAEALERADARRLTVEERQAAAHKFGRYYAEAYRHGNGPVLWRVQDRYMGQIAFFALDNPRQPARLEGYASKAEALKRILWFDRYFHERGIKIGPRASTLPDVELVADGVCQEPELPPAPTPRTTAESKRRKWGFKRATSVRHMVSQEVPAELWCIVQGVIPPQPLHEQIMQARTVSDRVVLAGLLHYMRNDIPWRHLPRELGCCQTIVRTRLAFWKSAGAWPKIEDTLYEVLKDRDTIRWYKADGSPWATEKARAALIERLEQYRTRHGKAMGNMGVAIFGDVGKYKRLLGRKRIFESTRLHVVAWLDAAEMPEKVARYRENKLKRLAVAGTLQAVEPAQDAYPVAA